MFQCEWGFAHYSLPTKQNNLAVFQADGSIDLMVSNGTLHNIVYDPLNGGKCSESREKSQFFYL